jgi:hypothetical protein
MSSRQVATLAASLGMLLIQLGCQAESPARVADTRQSPSQQQAPAEESPETPVAEPKPVPQPQSQPNAKPVARLPRRPVDSWVIYRDAFKPLEDSDVHASWTGSNRLEVHTLNVQRITLDLRRLPAGAPRRGPYNLQIDKQGIEITGARGLRMDLVRGKTGAWTVSRD